MSHVTNIWPRDNGARRICDLCLPVWTRRVNHPRIVLKVTRDGADKGGRESEEWDNVNTAHIPATLWQWSFTHLSPRFPLPLFHHLIYLRCSTADQQLFVGKSTYFFNEETKSRISLVWMQRESTETLFFLTPHLFMFLYLHLSLKKNMCLDSNPICLAKSETAFVPFHSLSSNSKLHLLVSFYLGCQVYMAQ